MDVNKDHNDDWHIIKSIRIACGNRTIGRNGYRPCVLKVIPFLKQRSIESDGGHRFQDHFSSLGSSHPIVYLHFPLWPRSNIYRWRWKGASKAGFRFNFPGKSFQPPVKAGILEAEQLRVGTIASKLLKLLDRGKSFRKQFSNSSSPHPLCLLPDSGR